MATAAPPATPPAGGAAPAAGPLVQSEMYRNYNFLLRVESAEIESAGETGLVNAGLVLKAG